MARRRRDIQGRYLQMSEMVYGPTHINDELARFQPDPDSASGRRAEILLKTDDLRVLLVTLRKDATMAEHSAPGTVTIQVVEGAMAVSANDVTHELAKGGLIAFAADVRHSVQAQSNGAILITIAWPTRSTS